MAFIGYDATSNSFPVQIAFVTDRDYVIYNNTQCALNVDIPSSVNFHGVVVGPGETAVYHADTDTAVGGAADVVGVPVHTAVSAGVAVPLENWPNGESNPNASGARLVASEF